MIPVMPPVDDIKERLSAILNDQMELRTRFSSWKDLSDTLQRPVLDFRSANTRIEECNAALRKLIAVIEETEYSNVALNHELNFVQNIALYGDGILKRKVNS